MDHKYNGLITNIEVNMAIRKIRPNKAIGIDKLDGDTIKIFFNTHPTLFINILKRIWESEIYPESWKMAKVVLIPKEGSDSPHHSAYRPMSIWTKIFDKILAKRLSHFLEINYILSPYQYGFRKK